MTYQRPRNYLPYFGIKNFKVFKELTEFDLRPVTILTGTNSSGKSSLTQALKLLQSCFETGKTHYKIEELITVTDDTNLGSYRNIVSRKGSNQEIIYCLPYWWYGIYEEMIMELTYSRDSRGDGENGFLKELTIKMKDDRDVVIMKMKTVLDNAGYPPRRGVFYNFSYSREVNVSQLKKLLDKNVSRSKNAFEIFTKVLRSASKKNLNLKEVVKNLSELSFGTFTTFPDHLNEISDNLFNEWKKCGSYLTIWEEGEFGESIPIQGFFGYKSLLRIETSNYRSGIHFSSKEHIDLIGKYKVGFPVFEYSYLNEENISYYKQDLKAIEEYEHKREWYFTSGTYKIDDPNPNLTAKMFPGFTIGIDAEASTNIDKSEELTKNDLLWEELVDKLEYNIYKADVREGANYKLFKKVINRGFESLYRYLEDIIGDNNMDFIPSIRSMPQRIMKKAGTSSYFEEILGRFSLSIRSDLKEELFKKWVIKFDIADDVRIKSLHNTGFWQVTLVKDNEEFNLIDVGYGYAQLLPILIKVIFLTPRNTIVVIEEPETNLHPALQSLLADFFVDMGKSMNIQFILETHSEYLIRKMQYLIAKDEIAHDQAIVYYLHHPDKIPEGEPQVKQLKFSEKGILQGKFGSGFTDEASNLAIDLFRLAKEQSN